MSSFVLCSDEVWKDKYQREYYKWFRLEEAEELLGHPDIVVYLYDDWSDTYQGRNLDFLQEQIEILARFGYIKLVYKDEDFMDTVYKPPVVHVNPPEKLSFSETTSSAVVAYEREDMDCEGGSCKI